MARFEVIHSTDAACIMIRGDRRKPEPTTAVIRFPGGHVEVSRTSTGDYWVHIGRNVEPRDEDDQAGAIVDSRIDYVHGAAQHYPGARIPDMPAAEHIEHVAMRIARA